MSAVLRAWRGAAWFVKGVLGEDAYQRYLDHHERTGCEGTPMTVREYWRHRSDWQERDPQGRCC